MTTSSTEVNKTQKRNLTEVSILRPFCILLLVILHSFTVFNHSWKPFEGFIDIPAYLWITRVTASIMLVMFVFLSGYVFSYQVNEQHKDFKFWPFVWKKCQRLIIPAIIFGLIYFFFLLDPKPKGVLWSCLSILSGIGHLWFLPMLFWCFIVGFFMNKLKMKEIWKMLILLALCIISWATVVVPLGIGRSIFYLFFFYLGFHIFKHKEKLVVWGTPFRLGLLLFIFIVSFLVTHLYLEPLRDINKGIVIEIVARTLERCGKIVFSVSGLLFIYLVVMKWLKRHESYTLPRRLVFANTICFGVYIFQQFILQILYYHTELPTLVGPYWLPWLGFTITLLVSVLLSALAQKTWLGKKIL